MPGRSRRFERPDYWILALVGVLCLIGMLMVFSSSGIDPDNPTYLINRHMMMLLFGAGALVLTMTVPYTRWRRYSVPAVVIALILLVLVLVGPSFISEEIKGAKRWLSLGNLPIGLQPSEFAKLAFVLYLADWCSTKGEKVRDFHNGLIPFGIMLGMLGGLVFMEPDMGTTLVIFSIGVAMYFVSGAALKHMAVGLLLAIGGFLLAAVVAPYRWGRVLSFMDPWHDPLGVSYHSVQSLLALGSGGVTGMGLGASRQKFGWLPEQSTDAIFSVYGQEMGFIGAALMISLFLLLAWRGYRVAQKAPDGFSSLVATGITTWLIFQAMLNIGAVSGAIPFTGVPLPFVSYGGSSLIITLAGVGLLLNISKYANSAVAEAPRPSPARQRMRVLRNA
ncbi:MAG TPA: putative lipid II flippase FtsW [Chloroflexia bacterium]|nr:putative lipid II flippase FtsW [Chloroflexia bacterium]